MHLYRKLYNKAGSVVMPRPRGKDVQTTTGLLLAVSTRPLGRRRGRQEPTSLANTRTW